MTATWIDPKRFDALERDHDIPRGTLKRIAPRGEYLSNLVRRLPGGEAGECAQALITEFAGRRESQPDSITGRKPWNGMC